jgi:hypothetical protein
MHSPSALQHERQKPMLGSWSSGMQKLHPLHTSDTSQRSPGLPVGVHSPPWHAYPGAQSWATVAVVHWLVQAWVGTQNDCPVCGEV